MDPVHKTIPQPISAWAKSEGIPIHSATMPLALAEHVVRFATEPGQLVVDPFGGWATTALAAERNARRWIITERMRAYLHAAYWRMLKSPDLLKPAGSAT